MEVVIPPRDHGDRTYKYAWDENGEVTKVQRVGGAGRLKQTRQTVQWPFQSTSLEDNSLPPLPQPPKIPGTEHDAGDKITSPEEAHLPLRPATWQPRSRVLRAYGDASDDDDDGETGAIRRSLIPDYVINYLRGETPETVAQRKADRQQQKLREDEISSQEGNGEDGDGAMERQGTGEPRLRGGGSSEVDRQQMPSPGYRRSDEPMLGNSNNNSSNFYNEKRRSLGQQARRRSYGQRGYGRRKRHGFAARGWRSGIVLHALIAFLVFVAGLVCLVLALTVAQRRGVMAVVVSKNDDASSSCYAAHQTAWILRALLAIFTMAVLTGAQYVFQVLSSPTRAELDAAHASRRWLDIGVPSLRNIFFLLRNRKSATGGGGGGARFRSVLALVSVAVALVSAVLYGSLIHVTLVTPLAATPDYEVLLVTPAFSQGGPFSNSTSNNAGGLDRVTILQLQQLAANTRQPLTNFTASECLQKQASRETLQQELERFQFNDETNGTADPRRFSAVLIVLKDTAVTALEATNSSVVQTAPGGSELLASDTDSSSTSIFEVLKNVAEGDRPAFIVDEGSVAFCLVQETAAADTTGSETITSTCDVTLNTTLLSVVIGLNLVTLLCFIFVLLRKSHRHFRHAPLITLGDAVASFLREPDATTRGACLLSKADVRRGLWKAMADRPRLPGFNQRQSAQSDNSAQSAQLPENIMQPMFLIPRVGDMAKDYYWFRSVSLSRWLVGSLCWLILAGLAIAALVVAVSNSDSLGAFGQIAPLEKASYGVFWTSGASSPSSLTAILASLPQLALAVLYLLADAHLSAYFLSHESSLYVAHQRQNEQLQQHCRRPLRVSHHPRGHQTASIYLTLPQLWNWLLLTLFAGLSFVLGESVVVTAIQTATTTAPQLVLLGFSGVGFIVFLVFFLVLAAVTLGLACRRSPPPPSDSMGALNAGSPSPLSSPSRNPLTLPGGSCSAVISARCHPMPEEMAVEMTRDVNGSNAGPLPLWLRPLAWGPVPAYHHPYHGYNRRHELTGDERVEDGDDGDDGGEEDNIDAIVGHCTFSSGPLVPLDTTRSYA